MLFGNGASENKSFHVESNWRLNKVTEGAVAIEIGSLFKLVLGGGEEFQRRHRLGLVEL